MYIKSRDKKPNVLVVEDEPDLIEIMSEKLKLEGFEVYTCSKVVRANQFLANQKFDCVVMDIKLEQGTGDQVIATMRRDKRNLNFSTPVVVVSGHLDKDLLAKLAKDVQGAFVKPFDRNLFVQKIKQLCGVAVA